MLNKFHDLAAIAFLENFNIIGVTESWVNTEKRDFLAEYNIPGYSLFSCERSERTGGSVLLYVKPHLHPQVITKPQISNIDVKYVQILSGSEKLILALVYRPPAQNSYVNNELYEQISDIGNHNDAIIFGDFNLPVTVWSGTLKEKKTLKSTIGPLLSAEGEIVTDERETADILNDYFASVFTVEEDRGEEATPYQMTVGAQLFLVDITEEDVMRVIDKLKICKSPGPDKIYPRILKEVKEAISKRLCAIFNLSLRTGKVVSEWKLVNVTPLFKKGDKSNPGNYRPISLTSVICKLMESILRDKIVEFLEKNNSIRDSQHGFRNRRSCLTNLLDFLYDIYEMYEEGRAVDIIYLDFQKAFDKVPHRKLLNKVESHGISGHIHRWISD